MRKNLIEELDDIVRFIWPDAKYDPPYNLSWQGTFSNIMFGYRPSKMLYGMYEKLLAEYPEELSHQQKIWITEAVKTLFGGSPAYIYYKNDDSILEEYKYLRYPSHIRGILFDHVNDYPKLIAAMGAWAVYQCDKRCLDEMLSKYSELGKEEKQVFVHQLVDSLSRTREDIFQYSTNEIKDTIELLQSHLRNMKVEDTYDKKDLRKAILFLTQGFDEKVAIEEYTREVKEHETKKRLGAADSDAQRPENDNKIIMEDVDRSLLRQRLGHIRWHYNIVSENLEDQEYIKRDIRRIAHIDWEEVNQLTQCNDRELATQMGVFKDAVSKIRDRIIWNRFDQYCSEKIDIRYRYPDGKEGDINRGLALCYGINHPEQEDALLWKVMINPRKYPDVVDMIVNGHMGVINDREETQRIQSEPAVKFLLKYNNYAKLRAMTNSVYSGEGITQKPYFGIASSIASNYYHQLKDTRNAFYQEMIAATGTSSRWKSEQQMYAVVKYVFPDAVYQYHNRWLGMQSLDVFIPSKSIGIEYQGLQHYEPVEIFGGEDGFRSIVERDARKRRLCEENGVLLIYWKYSEKITKEILMEKMSCLLTERKSMEY